MENDIMQILRWRRKAHSNTLKQFIKHYMGQWDLQKDNYGNLFTRIGTAPIMWSCHLDTVHRKEGWQNVRMDKGIIRQKGLKSRCLGADDGAGIWLLLEMLNKQVEGLYIFHLDEEIGGRGSDWITTWNRGLVEGIKYAVAFDRKNTGSIITNQWGVCCSDKFGDSLSKELGMGHILDTTGSFTDTDNYKDLIPECTNVSVGYFDEHKPNECLDFNYLQELREALFKLDVNGLVVDRDMTRYSYGTGRRGNGQQSYHPHSAQKDTDGYWEKYNADVSAIAQARRERERKVEEEKKKKERDDDARQKIIVFNKEEKDKEEEDLPVYVKTQPGMGVEKYVVKPGDSTKTTIENVERICSLNARKMARLFLDAGATYSDVLNGFLNVDMKSNNVARDDNNKDGWLSMIAKYVLGGK